MGTITTDLDELIQPSPTEVAQDVITAETCLELATTEDGEFLVSEDDTPNSNDGAYLDMESYHDYETNIEAVKDYVRKRCCCCKQ